MLELKKTPEHTIDRVFLLALLALFAATTFLVVSIGAKQYHSIADSMTANYETRTVSSYLEEKMNQNDVAGSVAVTSIGAFPAIALSETVNDAIYTTYIYCYDGYLREITVSDGTTVLPGDGQKIIETKALAIDMVSSNLYCFTITDTTGYTYPLYISLNAKSSLFLMEIILNILFFSILATFCVQIFFKGYQLSKSTEKLHQAVTACTSIAEICQSTDSPEETLSSIYPESMSLNETILIYYNKDFLACGKQNAVYRATVDFLPDQLATIHITFLDTSTAETLYELSASCYQPISLSTTGGMQYE